MKLRFRTFLTLSTAHLMSGAVHGIGIGGLVTWASSPEGPTEDEAEVSFFELDPTEAPAPPGPAAATTRTPDRPPVPSARRDRIPRPPTEDLVRPPRPEDPSPAVPPEDLRREILRSGRTTGDTFHLAPTDVALSTLSAPEARVRRARSERPPVDSREGSLEDQLTADLASAANRRPHLSNRPPPDLRRRTDGSYRYSGPRFAAVIQPDGQVAFNDAPGIGVNGPGTDHGLGIAGSFDLTEAFQSAAGQDPLRAERAWFMRETRELRERLMAQSDRTNQAEALSRLGDQLRSIWASEGSARVKRGRLFDQWDAASEDEVGRRARRRVLDFTRRVAPEDSDNAFSPEELQRLNARRQSGERFEPYRAAP